jgi:mercuric ion binding protein
MRLLTFLVAALLADASLAADRTVALDVPGMDCALCPITVKKALSRVSGVSRIEVSLEKKEALVTFDDARASVDALRRATADAGYPSSLKP